MGHGCSGVYDESLGNSVRKHRGKGAAKFGEGEEDSGDGANANGRKGREGGGLNEVIEMSSRVLTRTSTRGVVRVYCRSA